MSDETWELMHGDHKVESEPPAGDRTCFSRGGVSVFGLENIRNVPRQYEIGSLTDTFETHLQSNRSGWYGWLGFGGSVFQWHPELNIGFSYVPSDLFVSDLINYKSSFLQKAVVDACTEK